MKNGSVLWALLLALLLPGTVFAQATITGQITNEAGEGVADVQISVEGTNLGGTTQESGRYLLLNVPAGTYTIVAQHLGFATQRRVGVAVTRDGQAVVDFVMRTAALAMEGIVVTGVADPIEGVKVPFTIGRVDAENLAIPAAASPLSSLSGKVAGASIVSSSGQPGSEVNIMLRTPTSVTRNNNPMIVVDGVVLSSTMDVGFGSEGTALSTRDLESLDIESMEVIKGAAAASLYGSRAAAGVISITTKDGSGLQRGDTQIRARSEVGQSSLAKKVDLSRRHHFLQAPNGDWLDLAGNVVPRNERAIDPDNIIDNSYQTPVYDNLDQFFRPGGYQTHTVSVSQNSLSTNFLASASYKDEKGGLVNNDGSQRTSFRLNLDHRIGDNFTVSSSAYHARTRNDDTSGSPFWDLLMYEPDVDLNRRDADGNYVNQPDPTVTSENPIWRQGSRDNYNERGRTLLGGDVRWTPLAGLRFAGNMSYDRGTRETQVYVPKGTPVIDDVPLDGQFDRYTRSTTAMNGAVSASYMRRLGALTARSTVRATLERERREDVNAFADNLAVVDVADLDVGIDQSVSGQTREIRSNGYLATLGLDYDGKYIGDFLVRRDGSSLFGPDARWNNYFRAAGSYRMAQEDWWPFEDVTEFKVRYSIGTAGGRPNFSDQYETWDVSADDAGAVTVAKNTLGNRFLKPEFTTEHDIGFDMILRNRYSVQFSYISARTEDLLFSLPLPAVTGYSSQISNAGVQEGTTFEVTLEAQVINSPDLTWSTTLVGDRSRSEIVEWNRSCYFSGLRNLCSGAGLGEMWGSRFITDMAELPAGLNASEFEVNDEGYVVWVGEGNSYTDGLAKGLWGSSMSADGIAYGWGIPVLHRDSVGVESVNLIGRSEPDFSLGWLNNLRYKGVNFRTHLQLQVGGDIYNSTRQRLYQHERHAHLDQTGKADGLKKTVDYYQAVYNKADNTVAFVEDGTYLKLRALEVSYTFGQSTLQNLGLGRVGASQVDVGLIGRNLLTVTDYTGYDPEVGTVLQRRDNFSYPNLRNFTVFVEVVF